MDKGQLSINHYQLTIKKYPAYKDSNLDWLGKIPEHWSTKRLKYLLKEVNERTQTGDEELLSLSKYKGIVRKSSLAERAGLASTLVGYKKIQPGQLVINKMQAVNGLLAVSQLYGITSPDYSVYEEKSKVLLNIQYFSYLLLQPELLAEFKKRVTGVMEGFIRLYTDDLFDIKVVLPPLAEQTAIANFLDEKTAKIDTAIAQKERLIELLQLRQQIIIQNAVTKGIDPTVKMKDSGVEWLGEIPAHWEVRRAKYLFNEVDDRSKTGVEELLSVSHMTGVTPRSEKNVTMFMAEDYTGSKICQNGDLVINIMWAWMGALGVADRTGIVSPSYAVFRQKYSNTINLSFLEYLLKTTKYIEHYNKTSTGLHSSRLRFYSHMFFDMALAFPSIEEQHAIVAHIETQSAKIAQAINLQQRQIEKLKEYKAILINSAVTGKIKIA